VTFHLLSRSFPKRAVLLDLYKDFGFSETVVLCTLIHNVISCDSTKTDVIMTASEQGVPNGPAPRTVISLGES